MASGRLTHRETAIAAVSVCVYHLTPYSDTAYCKG